MRGIRAPEQWAGVVTGAARSEPSLVVRADDVCEGERHLDPDPLGQARVPNPGRGGPVEVQRDERGELVERLELVHPGSPRSRGPVGDRAGGLVHGPVGDRVGELEGLLGVGC